MNLYVKLRDTGEVRQVGVYEKATKSGHITVRGDGVPHHFLGEDCDLCDGDGNLLFPLTDKPKRRLIAEIDDTSAFGMPHHNHDKHRVFVKNLSYNQATKLQRQINNLLLFDDFDPSL